MSTLEKLKRKALLAAVARVDDATAGALLAVDQLHADWHTPVFVVNPRHALDAYVFGQAVLGKLVLPAEDEAMPLARALLPDDWSARVTSAQWVGPIPSLEYEVHLGFDLADQQSEPVLARSPFDAGRDTLLRQPFASMLRPDLASTSQWEGKTAVEILADLHTVVESVRSKFPPPPGAFPLFRHELSPMKLELDDERETRGIDWVYSSRVGGVAIMRPMAVCLASFADLGDDKLTRAKRVARPLKAPMPPSRAAGKRGQKRNRRQRREGRARHAASIRRQEAQAAAAREAEAWPGPTGDDRPDACTIHAEDIPRVGERALRVPFGGAW